MFSFSVFGFSKAFHIFFFGGGERSLMFSVRKGVRRSPVVSWRCRRVGHRCEQVQLFSAWWNPAAVYHLQTHHQAGSRHCDLHEDKSTRVIATALKSRLTAHVIKQKGVATEWWGGWRMRSVDHRLEWDYIRRQKKNFISPDLNNKNIYVYRWPVKTFWNVISALQYAILYNIFIYYAFRKLCRIKKRPNCYLKSKEFFFLIINLNIDRPHTFFCQTYKLWTLKTFPSFSIHVQLRVASISTSPINSDINISGSSNNNNLNY